MAQQKQPRRVEEVAPGLVRIVDGSTYVYLSSGSADYLADTRRTASHDATRGSASHRAQPQHGAQNA